MVIVSVAEAETLDIYPNPSPDGVFSLGLAPVTQVKAFDLNGREAKATYSKESMTVTIEGEPGVYFLHIGEYIRKVVKRP